LTNNPSFYASPTFTFRSVCPPVPKALSVFQLRTANVFKTEDFFSLMATYKSRILTNAAANHSFAKSKI